MKVNELRVGNWIYVNDTEYKPEIKGIPVVVKEILKNRWIHGYLLVVSDMVNREIHDISIEFTKPIPLTEDILLKCGFVSIGDSLLGYIFAKSLAYYVTKRHDYFAFRMNTLNDNSVFVREVKYLHELQNLYYAIENEELEVKLIK